MKIKVNLNRNTIPMYYKYAKYHGQKYDYEDAEPRGEKNKWSREVFYRFHNGGRGSDCNGKDPFSFMLYECDRGCGYGKGYGSRDYMIYKYDGIQALNRGLG